MDTLNSLYNQIDEFLQTNDQQTIDKFLQWFQTRTRFNETNASSSNFVCVCGHRYAIRWSIETTQRAKRSSNNNNTNHNSTTSKLFICTHCQIRLHTRETFLQHYSMHQQGLNYCKRCFQFHSDDDESHQCSTNKTETKFDELKSLEELIPPETIDSTESKEKISINEQETNSTAARLTRFGLPTLTDSVVEVMQSDGKRQFRCPLCLNSYVNRSGLNRHYITHSSQDLWKVECQFCGKRYSRKDSLKHHMKTQHAQYLYNETLWREKYSSFDENCFPSTSTISEDKQTTDPDEIVLIT